jgi:hypothetical protein
MMGGRVHHICKTIQGDGTTVLDAKIEQQVYRQLYAGNSKEIKEIGYTFKTVNQVPQK